MTVPLPIEIATSVLSGMKAKGEAHRVLDVREPWEVGLCALEGSLTIPMQELPARLDEVPKDDVVVVLCHHGARSLQVAAWLRGQGLQRVTSLAGGIDAWARECDPEMARY